MVLLIQIKALGHNAIRFNTFHHKENKFSAITSYNNVLSHFKNNEDSNSNSNRISSNILILINNGLKNRNENDLEDFVVRYRFLL